jgi:hypothetical protein
VTRWAARVLPGLLTLAAAELYVRALTRWDARTTP